ncbi:MAG: helix-turn-helix domain-containing protein [Bacteroidota bacterium]
MVVTKADNEEVTLKKSIKEYFLKTRPILESGICPTAQLFSGSMDKWSLFCIMNLGYYKVLRFNELKSNIKGISARMLSVTLKRLEQNDIVSRTVYAEVPPKVEYSLTPFGEGLAERLVDLGHWLLDNSTQLKESK